MTKVDWFLGDNREKLKTIEENSLDSCVTDPPYHLKTITNRLGKDGSAPIKFGTDGAFQRVSKGFMGEEWDGGDIAFDPEFWKLVFRVLKPGAHLVAFGGTRTFHRMVCAIEDAGFEIRDQMAYWGYGSGFPKSHNVALGIDKLNGHDNRGHAIAVASAEQPNGRILSSGEMLDAYRPKSAEAQGWEGFGTALKPSIEPICLARKPLSESSVARNVLKHGTGAINIDAGRIGTNDKLGGGGMITSVPDGWDRPYRKDESRRAELVARTNSKVAAAEAFGRWPANLILGCPCRGEHSPDCAVAQLDAQSGVTSSSIKPSGMVIKGLGYGGGEGRTVTTEFGGDSGGASRRERGEFNIHPTVKPVTLMRYLLKLVTPPGGKTIDPFTGSGTTVVAAQLEGFDIVACEMGREYMSIAQQRAGKWEAFAELEIVNEPGVIRQGTIFDFDGVAD